METYRDLQNLIERLGPGIYPVYSGAEFALKVYIGCRHVSVHIRSDVENTSGSDQYYQIADIRFEHDYLQYYSQSNSFQKEDIVILYSCPTKWNCNYSVQYRYPINHDIDLIPTIPRWSFIVDAIKLALNTYGQSQDKPNMPVSKLNDLPVETVNQIRTVLQHMSLGSFAIYDLAERHRNSDDRIADLPALLEFLSERLDAISDGANKLRDIIDKLPPTDD